MTTVRHLYVAWQWRLVRFVVGAGLLVPLTQFELDAAGEISLTLAVIGLVASAVPWTKLPWHELYANIQQQKLGLETTGSYLSRLQKEKYANYLGAKVKDVGAFWGPEAQVTVDVSSQLLWDLWVEELRGSATLDGNVVSRELRVLGPRSRPVLPRLRRSRLQVGFPVTSGVYERLRVASERKEQVHWTLDLELAVKFSSGETGSWTARDLAHDQVPVGEP